jgi:hypothetical protein
MSILSPHFDVQVVEIEFGTPIGIVSTGPKREETILRNEVRLIELTEGRLEV